MVFDGHSDILTDVVIKRLNDETNILNKYHLYKLKKGNIEGSCFVLWIDPPFTSNPSKRLKQIITTTFEELKECSDVVLVRNMFEIEKAKSENKFYILLGMEGLSSIGKNLDELYFLYDLGVRHTMLTWNEENDLATGVNGDEKRGLSSIGKNAISIIQKQKMILDISHLNEKSFWDVMKISNAPIIASHSNAKTLCNHKRNLTDNQLLEIRNTNGIVGLNSYKPFINNKTDLQNIDGLVLQATYIAEKIGVEHLSLGFDFLDFLDDETNTETSGLEDCTKVPFFIEKLKKAGFNDNEIELISYKNWYRIIRNCT